jgi:hypothetical protein
MPGRTRQSSVGVRVALARQVDEDGNRRYPILRL